MEDKITIEMTREVLGIIITALSYYSTGERENIMYSEYPSHPDTIRQNYDDVRRIDNIIDKLSEIWRNHDE